MFIYDDETGSGVLLLALATHIYVFSYLLKLITFLIENNILKNDPSIKVPFHKNSTLLLVSKHQPWMHINKDYIYELRLGF